MSAIHQIIWVVASGVMLRTVIGMCHCIDVLMPSRLQMRVHGAQHVHQRTIEPLSGSISLRVVWAGMSFGDASDLAKISYHSALKVAPLISMELCRESKTAKEVPPQHPGHSCCLLVLCRVGLGKWEKWSMQPSSMGALVYTDKRPAVGVFLRQQRSHC